jgi:hypothetical protein
MFGRKSCPTPPGTKSVVTSSNSPTKPLQWERHCIFNCSRGQSCQFGGLILFQNGSISSGHSGFRRREAIPDISLGRLMLQRTHGSDLLKITNSNGEIAWLEYEYGLYPKWYQVAPIGTLGPTDEPPPLRQRSTLAVELEKMFISFVSGAAGNPPPDFN